MKRAKYITGIGAMLICWTIGINTLLAHNKPAPAKNKVENFAHKFHEVQSKLELPAKEADITGIDLFLFEPLPKPVKKNSGKGRKKN